MSASSSISDGPYLELFARQNRPGWTALGNEVGQISRAKAFGANVAMVLNSPQCSLTIPDLV